MKELLTVIPTEFGRKIKKNDKIKKKTFLDFYRSIEKLAAETFGLLEAFNADTWRYLCRNSGRFHVEESQKFLRIFYILRNLKKKQFQEGIRNWTRIMSGTNVLFTVIQTEFAKNNFQKKVQEFQKNKFF